MFAYTSKMTQHTSDTIRVLRLPLTLLIVFIHFQILTHSERTVFVEEQIQFARLFQMSHLEILFAVKYVFTAILCRVAVPTFFFISGYLMSHDMKTFTFKAYVSKVLKRGCSLFYPYLLWNALTVIPVTLISAMKRVPVSEWMITNVNFATLDAIWAFSFSASPIDYPLWFCRDLIVLTLLVPLLFLCVSHKKWYMLLVFGAVYAAFPSHALGPVKNISVFFYALGMYFGTNGLPLVVRHKCTSRVLVVTNLMFFVLNIVYNHTSLQVHLLLPSFITSGVFVIVYIASKSIHGRVSAFLISNAEASFFIYACHVEFILPIFGAIREKALLDVLWLRCLFYLLVPIATVYIGIAYYRLVNHVSPIAARVLSGGR